MYPKHKRDLEIGAAIAALLAALLIFIVVWQLTDHGSDGASATPAPTATVWYSENPDAPAAGASSVPPPLGIDETPGASIPANNGPLGTSATLTSAPVRLTLDHMDDGTLSGDASGTAGTSMGVTLAATKAGTTIPVVNMAVVTVDGKTYTAKSIEQSPATGGKTATATMKFENLPMDALNDGVSAWKLTLTVAGEPDPVVFSS